MRTFLESMSTRNTDLNSDAQSRDSSDYTTSARSISNCNSKSQRLKKKISDRVQRSNSTENKSFRSRHKFRFWLNERNNDRSSQGSDCKSASSSSLSTKVDPESHSRFPKDYEENIVYKKIPRHQFRTWLNDGDNDNHDFETSSIIEIRQSNITRKIVRARYYTQLAAIQAAKIAAIRQTSRLMCFTGAITTAAFARTRAAQKDPNASHGSIANASMYGLRDISNAINESGAPESDYKKLNELFKIHFQHKESSVYFKRLKPLRVCELNPQSAAYKMYYKMKSIPNPPIDADPLEFYLNRTMLRQMKNQRIEEQLKFDPHCDKSLIEISDSKSMKSVQTRSSTAKSLFWSLIGVEAQAESTKTLDNSLEENVANMSEKDDEENSTSRSLFWSVLSGKS